MSYDPMPEPQQPVEPAAAPEVGANEGTFDEYDPDLVAGPTGPVSRGPMVLGGLLVVLAAVVWFMFFRGSPPAASAASGNSPAANDQVKQFLDNGNISMMKQTLKETQKIVKQFQSYNPAKTQVPLASLRTNPFRELAPSTDAPAVLNDDKDLEFHKQALQAVADLRVQSIILGKRHACMMNNTFYQEGQQVGILKIDQITPTAVLLSAGRYRFEVKMQK